MNRAAFQAALAPPEAFCGVRDSGPWPRGLRRPDAARYVGVGLTKFDEMVADGRMPKPKTIDSCIVWDRNRLDDAFDSLPDQGPKLDRSRWKAST
jgi:predicted DNA-binding transcriptional regulator AlpA